MKFKERELIKHVIDIRWEWDQIKLIFWMNDGDSQEQQTLEYLYIICTHQNLSTGVLSYVAVLNSNS